MMTVIHKTDRRLGVVALEPQPILAEGLRTTFDASSRYELLERVTTLPDLGRSIAALSPRIALIDRTGGLTLLTAWLKGMRQAWQTAAVVWGTGISEAECVTLLNAGARAVLRKTADADTLLACLDNVCQGATWMDESLLDRSAQVKSGRRTELTARERQVLELVEQGMRNKEIAQTLGIRPGTVKIHMKHIFGKTGIRGRFGLALSGWRDRGAPERVVV
jgi:two-component system nitrate/nitrite response regulator NarL